LHSTANIYFTRGVLEDGLLLEKKDVCPICCEKVDLSLTFVNPWEKQSILWGNILDAVRYLIVWNPLILMGISFVLSTVDTYAHISNKTTQ